MDSVLEDLELTVGKELLRIHRCYYPLVNPLLEEIDIKGMAHVTGGGIVGNAKRILPEGLKLRIDWRDWDVPPLFKIIQQCGQISDEEMRKTFNLGIGYILIVGSNQSEMVIAALNKKKEKPIVIGKVV